MLYGGKGEGQVARGTVPQAWEVKENEGEVWFFGVGRKVRIWGSRYHRILRNAVVGFGTRKANEDYGKILVSIVGF